MEGDTLDPQTGLFYRSVNPLAPPPPPTPPPPLQQHRTPTPTLSKPVVLSISTPTKSTLSQTEASKLSPSTRPPALAVTTRVDKPAVSPAQSLSAPSISGAQHAPPTKPVHTPQLPRLQQAPSSHNRPNTHTQLSQPPPLQAHHPITSDKAASSSSQVGMHTPARIHTISEIKAYLAEIM